MSTLKSQVKKVRAAIEAGDSMLAEEEYRKAAKLLDREGCRRLIHPNAAGRTKSRLQRGMLRVKLLATREQSQMHRGARATTENACGQAGLHLVYGRHGSTFVGVPGLSSTPIGQLISQDSNIMDGPNHEIPARPDSDVTITAWPSDLTVSIEMRLARRSLSEILKSFQGFHATKNFRRTDEYLLVPKVEEYKRAGADDDRQEVEKTVPWTTNALVESMFQRCPPQRNSVEYHLGSATVVAPGILVVEGNAGDIRLYRLRAGGYGVLAALWLSDSLADVGEDIVRTLHQHGNDASLRHSCREAINDVVSKAVAVLEKEIGKSNNAGQSNT